MNKDLLALFDYFEQEKGLKRSEIIAILEEALSSAVKKGLNGGGFVHVSIDPKSAEISSFVEKEIVHSVTYPNEEISLQEAKAIDPQCQLGEWMDIEISVQDLDLARIAAQLARQLIQQKFRYATREVIYKEYRKRIGELVSGSVSRISKHNNTLIVNLGKVDAILPARFYPKTERYHVGDRILALLYDVQDTENGSAEVILSRSHPEFVKALFMQEVPELQDGTIQINRIVREPGFRTKMTVSSSDPKTDPVGSLVGVRGSRVKNVIREINEKIDIIPHANDSFVLLKLIFSPIEIQTAKYDEEKDIITLVVKDANYPIILGKKGTNVRLTSELIETQVEVKKLSDYQKELVVLRKELVHSDNQELDQELKKIDNVNQFIINTILESGINTPRKLLQTSPVSLSQLTDISLQMAEDVLEQTRKQFSSDK